LKRLVIIGGGVSGLATALNVRDRAAEIPGGVQVTVLESSPRAGGNIQTDQEQGYSIEWGPNGYLDNVPTTPALVRRLGLEDQLQQSDESAARRFMYRGGRLHLLPSGPVSFLGCGVLSLPGRLRVLLEPFAGARPDGVDETVHDFARRRIGDEAARILIDAMVSGVFAGDSRQLSLASTFPKMARMEADHGGLVKAMLARMKERRAARRDLKRVEQSGGDVEELTRPGGPAGPGGTLTSFRGGLEVLVRRLAEELGDTVRLRCGVEALQRDRNRDAAAWAVRTKQGETLRADAVVVTTPSPRAAPLLDTLDPKLAEPVRGIPTAPLAVVALAYEAQALGGAPNGFGFLVPRGQGPRILGCLWDSSIFPGRAPRGKVLVRAMIGGAHDPEAMALDDRQLLQCVRQDLETAAGWRAEPIFSRIYRHPLGIGQYVRGHGERLEAIHQRLRQWPGLWVAGSAFYGVSINNCVEKASTQSAEIAEFLA
jgi:oxygen-dependent protoporphyrinogen oxidase